MKREAGTHRRSVRPILETPILVIPGEVEESLTVLGLQAEQIKSERSLGPSRTGVFARDDKDLK
jgi:hypothetical protein